MPYFGILFYSVSVSSSFLVLAIIYRILFYNVIYTYIGSRSYQAFILVGPFTVQHKPSHDPPHAFTEINFSCLLISPPAMNLYSGLHTIELRPTVHPWRETEGDSLVVLTRRSVDIPGVHRTIERHFLFFVNFTQGTSFLFSLIISFVREI